MAGGAKAERTEKARRPSLDGPDIARQIRRAQDALYVLAGWLGDDSEIRSIVDYVVTDLGSIAEGCDPLPLEALS
jgi:hypothetical protein